MNIKHQTKLFLTVLLFCLAGLIIGYTIMFMHVHQLNSEQRQAGVGETYCALEYREPTMERAVNNGWKFHLNRSESEPYNYYGMTYEYNIVNHSDAAIRWWELILTVKKPILLNVEWNGDISITRGNVTVDAGNLRPEHLTNETRQALSKAFPGSDIYSGNFLVKLQKGDVITYHPDADTAREYPLDHRSNMSSIGFIWYCPLKYKKNSATVYSDEMEDWSNYELDFPELDYRLIYSMKYSVLRMPFFPYIVMFTFLWIIFLTAFLVYLVMDNQTMKRLELDDNIIRQSIGVFTEFIDAKDVYTKGHSRRVAQYSTQIAQKLNMPQEQIRKLHYIALMHDCGKVYIPDNILKKQGSLSDEEFEIIKTHTTKGREMLSNFTSVPGIEDGALYHHEFYDGSGYPEGLSGEKIPLVARIICVADCYDAMSTDRYYRSKCSKDYIIEELRKQSGTQFDPKIADIMIHLILDDEISWHPDSI
uniref:HD-GYP domain-containing protein n=1 Tax=Eubacterium cellulosolvens TaxID=29322 RepID=UPI0006866221|nr:HD-GYP domain-containing protein [[Eubacterium] cellulosolvens]